MKYCPIKKMVSISGSEKEGADINDEIRSFYLRVASEASCVESEAKEVCCF